MKVQAFRNATIAAALAFLLILFSPLSAHADDGDRLFTFVAQSQAATIGGVQHRTVMQGSGTFNAEDGEVEGGGIFVHFNNAAPIPKPIIASGTWKAKEFVSYLNGFGNTYGHIEAGILVMKIDLTLDGSGEVVRGVTLRIACNIGALGVMTGEAEGYVLTIPGAPFGAFRPLDPVLGLTLLSTVSEESAEEHGTGETLGRALSAQTAAGFDRIDINWSRGK